jgi:PKD domain
MTAVVVSLAVVSLPAEAPGAGFVAERVFSPEATAQSSPIETNATGAQVVAWQAPGAVRVATRSSSSGEWTVESVATNVARNIHAGIDNAGNVSVAWVNHSSNPLRIEGAFRPAGGPIGWPAWLSSESVHRDAWLDMDVDHVSGTVGMVWITYGPEGAWHTQRLLGKPPFLAVPFTTNHTPEVFRPQAPTIEVDGTGAYVGVTDDWGSPKLVTGIDKVTPLSSTASSSGEVELALEAGRLVAIWPTAGGLRSRERVSGAADFGPEVVTPAPGWSLDLIGEADMDETGRICVLTAGGAPTPTLPHNRTVAFTRTAGGGAGTWSDFPLAPGNQYPNNGVAAVGDDGRCAVAWRQSWDNPFVPALYAYAMHTAHQLDNGTWAGSMSFASNTGIDSSLSGGADEHGDLHLFISEAWPAASARTVVYDSHGPELAITGPARVDVGAGAAFGSTSHDRFGASTVTWAFGDGTTSAAAGPVHAFAAPGRQTVTATATDERGNATSKTAVVQVWGSAGPAPMGPAPAPHPTSTLPTLELKGGVVAVRRGVAGVTLTCLDPQGCAGKLAISCRLPKRTARQVVASKLVSLMSSRAKLVRFGLNRAGTTALARQRSLACRLHGNLRDSQGDSAAVSRPVTLRRPSGGGA